MSDPPPKPLSLRERIAQFEKSSTTAATPAPAPHVPKKLGQWKPPNASTAPAPTTSTPISSVGSPASPPPASTSSEAPAPSRGGMMSASDAQESIRAGGGSLKERMAMLRGSGGFSGPGGSEKPKSPPPKPIAKPKPVVAAAPRPIEAHEPSGEGEADVAASRVKSPSLPTDNAADPSDEPLPEQGEAVESNTSEKYEPPAEDDAEDEERKRRAAIAARMARLGGARFGMGAPPAFGSSRPSADKHDNTEKEKEQDIQSPESAALLDAPSPPPRSVSPNIPPAMPMPAAPRRAGPPRRKVPAKSDSTKTEEEAQAIAPTSNAEVSEVQEVPKVIENAPDTEDKEETEEDEVARKKRIAEKMAQMGGVNPLAPRPEIPTPSASMQEVPLAAEPEGGYEAGEESGAEKATEEEVGTPPEPVAHSAPIGDIDNDSLVSPPPVARSRSPPALTRGTTEEERVYEKGGYEDDDEGEAPHLAQDSFGAPRKSTDAENSPTSSTEESTEDAPPPPPPRRSSVDVSSASVSTRVSPPPDENNDDEPTAPAPPPPRRTSVDSSASRRSSVQLPTHTLSPSVAEEAEQEQQAPPPPARKVTLDSVSSPLAAEDDDERAPQPPARRSSTDIASPSSRRASAELSSPVQEESGPPPPPPRRTSLDMGAPTSRHASAQLSLPVEEQEEGEDFTPSPHPPPRVSSPRAAARLPPPRIVPPTDDNDEDEFVTTQRSPEEEPTKMIRPRYAIHKGGLDAPPPSAIERADSAASNVTATPDREVLDDDEGDPIDPEVYYHTRQSIDRASTPTEIPSSALSPTEEELDAPTQADEDAEAEVERRRRIAERMAKLGGIRFGVAPQAAPPAPSARREVEEGDVTDGAEPEDDEEEERKRKERIAAKLARMGGMMPGMMGIPGMARPPPPKHEEEEVRLDEVETEQDVTEAEEEEEEDAPPPPPPARTRPHVPAASHAAAADIEEDEVEDDTAPPPHPPARSTRPPVPAAPLTDLTEDQDEEPPAPPPRRGSVQMPPVPPPGRRASTTSTKRKSTASSSSDMPGSPPPLPPSRHVPTHPSENFVMVEEPEQGWEMDFGDTDNIASTLSAPTAPPAAPTPAPAPAHMNEDDLMRVWGRVGVQVCEIATTLYEKSKKSPLPSSSFIDLVLESVPTASTSGRKYLIAKFTPTNSDKDVIVEPMPGDIVHFESGSLLKGQKKGGLQSYHQNFDEDTEGIISDYKEGSRKIKAFVRTGSGAVDSASYKLEDLKSGSASVYRVLEDGS